MSGRWVRRASRRNEEAAASAGARLTAGPTGIAEATDEAARPLAARELRGVYDALLGAYGEQQWWPTAATEGPAQRLEICLGAILTQNTAWKGAERSLQQLRAAEVREEIGRAHV